MKKTRLKLKKEIILTTLQVINGINIIKMILITLLATFNNKVTSFYVLTTIIVFFSSFIFICVLEDLKQKKTHESLENLESRKLQN